MAKIAIGDMPCEGPKCKSHERGQRVVVFRNDKGTLSYSCDWCGRSPYTRAGQDQNREWLEAVGTGSSSEPVPAVAPVVAAVPAVPSKKKSDTFF